MSGNWDGQRLVAGGVLGAVCLWSLLAGCAPPAGSDQQASPVSQAAAPIGPPEATSPDSGATAASTPQTSLLVEFPDYCNTPDGMARLPGGEIIISVPNFNDETQPSLLAKLTLENQIERFYDFPMPFPGLAAPADRIGPMGITYAAKNKSLYVADMQIKEINQHSRVWRLDLENDRVSQMVLVASGFNVANGLAVRGDYLYVTESVLKPSSDPPPAEGETAPATFTDPLVSAVLRFKLDEENVQLATPLESDPHVIATFKSYKTAWPFGADGIAFDSKGNLFIGLFGDGILYKLEFDADGQVASNVEFAKAPFMINCDGMSCDPETDKLYVADSAANAIRIVHPDGTVETLAENDDVTDKHTGLLDQPCEALLPEYRGRTVVVSNMDWPFPGFKNSGYQLPATLSLIQLP